ncbi:hypothetical protein FB45DRAFT_1029092 [Roridomyces roridus]|uniref:Uncharacterized protein n=1 Tax=Roridomyces roridus TaxID=1738132 RepID=A0AAD7BS77_9AGAR|nr:hypothetical protein FB45DRAFT_1029092 [Roridomyces roridus]
MGRWTQRDEDSERLPEGMERIGYDSDTGRYYFRDQSGALGLAVQLALINTVSGGGGTSSAPQDDVESAPRRSDGYQPVATDAGATGYWRTHSPNARLCLHYLSHGILIAHTRRVAIFR